ncbi:septal ring lytic transglycosylase RlpA family protein [Rhodospirillaceae bacterium SYSU D60014]|uniref:septal ring lytic transglycosylase RlpA family protein n=1 Tax=Virgifigura deserti TaxID=2268457 RepID=UPI000E664905
MGHSAVSLLRAIGLLLAIGLTGCAETTLPVDQPTVATPPPEEAVGRYKIGNPYKIGGVWYYPAVDYEYEETGVASWYGPGFDGRLTANGERYDMNGLTAAHRTLPLPSVVRVTNLENGRALTLRVNDRGPFAHGRIIDVSRRAAQLLGFEQQGTAKVRVEIMPEESLALAMQQSGGQYAAAGPEEMTPKAAPAIAVASEVLPPPGGSPSPAASQPSVPSEPPEIAAEPLPATQMSAFDPAAPDTRTDTQTPVQPAETKAEPLPPTQVSALDPTVPDARLSIQPVWPTQLFIQAGAFANYQNAYRLSALLSSLGPAKVSSAFVGGQQFFRVRLGPIDGVDKADRLLEQVIRAGHSDARIVVQ